MEATTEVVEAAETTEADDASVREREHYEEIRELNCEFQSAHQDWEVLKDRTAGAKKLCDELGKRLSNLIARGPDYQRRLGFEEKESTPEPVENDAWRDVQVEDALALTSSQYEKLEGEGIRTMGELEDFRGSKGLASIKGFGEKAVTKIEDQIIEWLTENRDRFGEAVDEDVPDSGPVDDEGEDTEADEDDDESDTDSDPGDDQDEDAGEILDDM